MRLIKITEVILISFLFFGLTNCNFKSEYHKLVEREIIKGEIDILPINYDDFNKDNFATIKSILSFYKLSKFEEKIEHCIQLSLKIKEKSDIINIKITLNMN